MGYHRRPLVPNVPAGLAFFLLVELLILPQVILAMLVFKLTLLLLAAVDFAGTLPEV